MNKHRRNAYFLIITSIISRLSANLAPLKLLSTFTQKLSSSQEACRAYGTQDADECFQKIAYEAQVCAGIPNNKILPIKQVNPASEKHAILAFSSNGVLFINQYLLNRKKTNIKSALGQLRLALFHEAIHAKQFHTNGSISVINPVYCSPEQEADIQGALLANCWHCTTQYAENAKDENDNSPEAQHSRAQGYASRQMLMAIAKQQKKCQACCVYHAQQDTN